MSLRKKTVYINNPTRAHKLLVLLEQFGFEKVSSLRDILRLRGKNGELGAVMVDTFGRFGLLALGASTILRLPLVCRLRGEFFREEREKLSARRGFLRFPRYLLSISIGWFCLNRAQRIIVNSEYMKKAMEHYIIDKNTSVVYNPCFLPKRTDSLDWDLPNGRLKILTITNMNFVSKVTPLIGALDKWITPDFFEEVDAYWIICGHGYYFERVRTVIFEKGLETRVLAMGWQREVEDYLRWCHVMVHLTNIDAFPNVTMEAMIRGKPVITNAESCGTLEQVFDGVNGFVVSGKDSFSSALKAYILDPALRISHGNAGRKLVEEMFSIKSQRKAMRAALSGLI